MTDVREARAAAIRRRARDLSDDFNRGLPLLLDDLETIDAQHTVPVIIAATAALTDEQIAEFRAQWEAEFRAAQTAPETAKPLPRRPTARRTTPEKGPKS